MESMSSFSVDDCLGFLVLSPAIYLNFNALPIQENLLQFLTDHCHPLQPSDSSGGYHCTNLVPSKGPSASNPYRTSHQHASCLLCTALIK